MTKKLNTEGVINELTGQSAFFKDAHRLDEKPTERSFGRSENKSPSRVTKRHSFEIYTDQLDDLQKIKAQSMIDGEKMSMSEMVRDAIDKYLSEERK